MRIIQQFRHLVLVFSLLVSCFALAQSNTQILVYINGEPITMAEFENAFSQNDAVQTLRSNKSNEVQSDLKELVFRRVLTRKLIEQGLRFIVVSNTELESAIKKDRQRLNLSDSEFAKYLTRSGFTIETYRQQILLDLRGERFSNLVTKGLSFSPEEFDFIKSLSPESYSSPVSLVELRKQILGLKSSAELEAWLIRLEATSEIQYLEQSPAFTKDAIIATVNNEIIRKSELLNTVYLFPNLIGYMDLAKYKSIITEKLIDQRLTSQRAIELDLPFVGSASYIHEQVFLYESRNAIVNDKKAEEYYKQNMSIFQIPATARVQSVAFPDQKQANRFRAILLKNGDLTRTARQFNAPISEHDRTRPKDWASPSRNAIFVKPTQKIGKIEVSAVTPSGKLFVVYVIRDRTKAISPTFLQVRPQIQKILMPLARAEKQAAWIETARANAEIKIF